MTFLRGVQLAIAAAAFMAAASALAQRASLAERVERLEAQALTQNQTQANIELLNRINALQQELASQRGLVEQLQNDNARLRQTLREQYIDVDSRLIRLEGVAAPAMGAAAPVTGGPAALAAPAAPVRETAPPAPAAPAAPAGLGGVVAGVANAPLPGTAANPASERELYDSAFQALRDGEYAEASRRFQAYLEAFPNGSLAPNAWYWLGESYYVTQNYAVALQAFQNLLQAFPDSSKAADALLKVGYSQFELGRSAEGESTLREVIARFPGSDAARLAQSRLRTLALDLP
ncbi:tol-pal system protein YbgF [Silanimonas sp.]|uniref:tol-pal system protein YbgF n=1 Tax=Silanimonas sp. TaxID=1929290 RepID=UPI001BBCA7DD|nr:tol-pal system protein YbgF [Silanimonas sp.]MBS3895300.1 tol-pal system protein YbgF [Silanimonas sp.]MBS3923716.1 tol-pal system protein YbgF [Xanthomonadaceae bacterium]